MNGYSSRDGKYSLKGIVCLHPERIVSPRADMQGCKIVPVKNTLGIQVPVYDERGMVCGQKTPDFITVVVKS